MKHGILAGVSLAALVACGSSGSTGYGSTGGAGSSGGSSGGSSSGSSGASAVGTIAISQTTDTSNGAPTYKGTVSAELASSASAATGCQTQTQGACTISVCPAANAPASAPPGGWLSAGAIAVSGTASPATISPGPDKSYQPAELQSTAGPFIPPGAQIHVQAAGGDIPAFSASLTMGGAITVTAPAASGLSVTLGKGDVPVTWTGGGSGDHVRVMLTANSASDSSKAAIVTCAFSGGSGTIPKAAMDALTAPGAITIGPVATADVTAGAYTVATEAWVVSTTALFTK